MTIQLIWRGTRTSTNKARQNRNTNKPEPYQLKRWPLVVFTEDLVTPSKPSVSKSLKLWPTRLNIKWTHTNSGSSFGRPGVRKGSATGWYFKNSSQTQDRWFVFPIEAKIIALTPYWGSYSVYEAFICLARASHACSICGTPYPMMGNEQKWLQLDTSRVFGQKGHSVQLFQLAVI